MKEDEFCMTQENLTNKGKSGEVDAVSRALANIYTGVFSIDLVSDRYVLIKSQKEVMKLIADIVSAREAIRIAIENTAASENLEEMLDFIDLDTLPKRMKTECFLNREYMGTLSGWVRGSFIEVERDENKTLTKVLYAYQVIDAEKRIELEKQQAMRDACAAAERANVAKTAFLSRMTHDIRTPMNGIIGMTTLAISNLNRNNLEKVGECLAKINTSSTHLLGIINEALDMGQIESGKFALNCEEFNFMQMIEDVKDVIEESAKARKHQLDVSCEEIVHTSVYGDDVRLRKALINILGNAIKYTPDGGKISMEVTEKSTNKEDLCCFEFVIQDNGIGMSKEFLPHLFLPFEREHNDKTSKIQGTGLGMVITKNIIQLMNGDIQVESEPGVGTKFVVTVYMGLQNGVSPARKVSIDKTENILNYIASLDYSKKKILLVEDNELNREVATEIIALTNAKIEVAENGKAALNMIVERPAYYYDLIFMDIQMPVMDGYEATRAIRQLTDDYTKEIPIIAMSANAFAEDVIAARQAGMNDHIAKPLDLKKLAEAFEQWMNK